MDVAKLIQLNWSALRRAAQEYVREAPPNAFTLAKKWYNDAAWQVRFFAVIVLGGIAAKDERALTSLFEKCGDEPDWQVNEALAMAFDDYCAAIGYQKALPAIRQWIRAPSANLRRAVSEGLRPWTASQRAYFAVHPQAAIDLLGRLKDDESRSVQESVGNALRDISRKQPELVADTIRAWVEEKPESKARQTIFKFASKNKRMFALALRSFLLL